MKNKNVKIFFGICLIVVITSGFFSYEKTNPTNADWYYYGANLPARTSTWTGAHEFRQYWGNVNGSGYNHAYAMAKYLVSDLKSNFTPIYLAAWPGDIIQWTTGSNGQTQHSMIVQSYNNSDLQVAYRNAAGFSTQTNYSLKLFIATRSNNDWITLCRIKNGS